MSHKPCGFPQKSCEKPMNAAALSNPSDMIAQMVLPLADEMGRERAIEKVARDTGLTYSKTYRLFYRQSTDVWSRQKEQLTKAFKRFAQSQERLYSERAARYAAINAEIERLERQHVGNEILDQARLPLVVEGSADVAQVEATRTTT